ncbi:FMRFamide receptor [Parasteatoda tepidariorum]|uniref:FMRFamide receptor n=1 Tax=Parasteatoda tepidariorum TaxID=114398 RepID=UPI00077FBD90|nr:FMRFamide receptor [Parasteatoda tepidariorum]XP_015918809.1 FMRFamide receptor [Parasteatoda tepidariorum]
MLNVSDQETNCRFLENLNCSGKNCSFSVVSCNDTNWTMIEPNINDMEPDPEYEAFQLNSRFWIQRVFVPIIMTIGVIGNTVTVFIMTQRRMRSSTNWYLAALAIFDVTYLVFSFALSLQHYPHIHEQEYNFYWILWPYMLTITDVSSNSSVWITVTFTIERYIAVCHPMKGKVICTESRAKKMIMIVFIFCFCVTLPTGFEWNTIEVIDTITNTTKIQVVYSDLGNNPVYVQIYYWVISVLFVFIPLFLLAVFNAFLIKSVHSSKTRRKTMTRKREGESQARQESKITVMLIAVVILFLVCQLPTAITLLYKAFHHIKDRSNEDLLLRGLGNIFNFLVAVNAAGNFVLYCLLSQKYRRTFILIFCPCLKSRLTRLHSVCQNTGYTTVDGESPAASRKYSVRTPALSKTWDGNSTDLSQQNMGNKQYRRQQSAPATSIPRQQQLSFSKNVAVFSADDSFRCHEDTNDNRLLRGFRYPWTRTKVASGVNEEDRTGQFIPLKSPTKDVD